MHHAPVLACAMTTPRTWAEIPISNSQRGVLSSIRFPLNPRPSFMLELVNCYLSRELQTIRLLGHQTTPLNHSQDLTTTGESLATTSNRRHVFITRTPQHPRSVGRVQHLQPELPRWRPTKEPELTFTTSLNFFSHQAIAHFHPK